MSCLKLSSSENRFAKREITKYYESYSSSKYSTVIDETLSKFEHDITDFDELKSNDESENIIIKKLLKVFLDELYEQEDNPTGILGVKKGYYQDKINWGYKNPIKKEFVPCNYFFARSLAELKSKIHQNKGIWYVIDAKVAKKARYSNISYKRKSIKTSKENDLIKELNFKIDDFEEIRKKERENRKKWDKLEEETGLNKKNERYKNKDKFFK